MTDTHMQERVRAVIADAVARLTPEDRAHRIAWCRAHKQHGVRMNPPTDDAIVEFTWGGKSLALVPLDVLEGDGPIAVQLVAADPPDSVPDDWTPEP